MDPYQATRDNTLRRIAKLDRITIFGHHGLMKSLIVLLLAGYMSFAPGQDRASEVPAHLQGMRSWYEREVQLVQKAYLSELQETRKAYLNANQPESAKDVEAEIARVQKEIPGFAIIGKTHPATSEELMNYLHETTWSIRYSSTSGEEVYQMTFDKSGTLKLNTGRVSKLEIYGPKTIRLWAFDTATMSDQFNFFTSVDCNGKVYYGVLLPQQT